MLDSLSVIVKRVTVPEYLENGKKLYSGKKPVVNKQLANNYESVCVCCNLLLVIFLQRLSRYLKVKEDIKRYIVNINI